MSTAPLYSVSVPSADSPTRMRRRIGHRGVADAVPHAADADAAPHGPALALNAATSACAWRQCGRSASRHCGEARECCEHLAGRRRVAGAQRVAMAELQAIDAEPVGQLVDHRLVRDRGLRHAEAAECAGRRTVGEDRLAPGAHVGHGIRPRGVDRHAIGDRRAPRGIGAGVEIAVTSQATSLPSASQPNCARDARRMALGVAAMLSGRV